MKGLLLCVPALVMLAVPAFAQETSANAAPAATNSDITVKLKKVCRTTAVTGRRIPETSCRTAEQWAAADKANEDAARNSIENLLRQSNYAGPGANPNGGSSNGIMGMGTQPQ